jgi:hypothetical protein
MTEAAHYNQSRRVRNIYWKIAIRGRAWLRAAPALSLWAQRNAQLLAASSFNQDIFNAGSGSSCLAWNTGPHDSGRTLYISPTFVFTERCR